MCILGQLGRYILQVVFVLKLHGTELLLKRLEDDEQGGNDQHLQQRTNEHTAHGSSTQRLVTVLTYT